MEKKQIAERIKEGAEELKSLERSLTKGLVRDRVGFIRLLKQQPALNIPTAAQQAGGYKKSWGYKMWELYEQKGVAGLSAYPFKGTKPRLSKEQVQTFIEDLRADHITTLHQAAMWIKQKTGISYCDSAVWFIFKGLGIKKKTGRPSNVRKDQAGAEAFKKKRLL